MQQKMINEAAKSCARLVTIFSELSDIAKLDSGAIALTQQPIDVFAIVGEVAAHMHEASERDVRLDLRGVSSAAPAIGDPDRLRAAFAAIFRSILRERAGPCTVVAERRRDVRDGRPHAVVVVADEADVQAVYDSAAGEFDERRGGMGLALPLARRVVERHGGTISAPAPLESGDRRPWTSAIIAIPIAESTR
jgi:signal transduction histidine kinase